MVAKCFKSGLPLIESERGLLKRHLDEYLEYGGFPELLEYDRIIKIRTLKEYIYLMIYRDLVERYGIEKISALKFMIKSLVRNFARELSVRKLENYLLSAKVSLSHVKVYEYFSYLEDINFILLIRKYGKGVREVEGSIPKIYLIDLENINTRERELKSLVKVSKELECTDLLVITRDYGSEEDFRGNRIRFVPLWKWLPR